MQFVIWGAGQRGEVIYNILGKENVLCFIDSNEQKRQKPYLQKKVISYEEYKANYRDYPVVVSTNFCTDMTEILDKDNLPYFLSNECPTEFSGAGLQKAKNYFEKLFNFVPSNSALYGISLYSVWLYCNLIERGKSDIAFIVQKNINKTLLNFLKKTLPNMQCITQKQAQEQNRQIFACFYDDDINDKTMPKNFCDIFDLQMHIVDYTNPRIAKLKNAYKGKTCFIVATGPSLKIKDLDTLHKNGAFCISMNTIFNSFDETAWRPDIYTITDGMCLDLYQDKVMDFNIEKIFLSDSTLHIDHNEFNERFYFYHVYRPLYNYNHIEVSDDFAKRVYYSGTVTFTCIQLAYYLGFSTVYLLGVDFNYNAGKNNHFKEDENAVSVSKALLDASMPRVHEGYVVAKQYADAHGIKIYNATRGGKLEVFERVNFDTLFIEVSINRNGGGNKHLSIFAKRKFANKKFAFNASYARSSCTRRVA